MEINKNPHTLHFNELKALTPAFRYDGKGDFTAWQAAARARLVALLGLDKLTPASDDAFAIESVTEGDTYHDHRFRFMSEEGYFVIATLRVPKGKEGKLPLVICLQGHTTGAHISLGIAINPDDEEDLKGGDRDFAVQIAREGYCALALEQRCFGECGGTEKGPACGVPTLTGFLLGRTTLGERVFDVMRAIDVVTANFSFIDAERIACMGNSGGGTATIYASALDERIKLSMPSCALCTFKASIGAKPHCTCNFVPNIALDFDMGDFAGLIAPRPLIVVSGVTDWGFMHEGVVESVDVAKTYYEAAGAPDRIEWVPGPEGHRFYADLAWPVFHRFFD